MDGSFRIPEDAVSQADGVVVRLSEAAIGDVGVIVDVRAELAGDSHGVAVEELQRRLLEFGFVEGARIEVIHEGAVRHDPIAVRLDDMRVALRRRDAGDIFIRLDGGPHAPTQS
jgi:ferrous iron transport protein A